MSLSQLKEWVADIAALARPDHIHWCDGSGNEQEVIRHLLVKRGTLIPLNPKLRPNSYLARTNPKDVARVEDKTFICSENEADAGPTNNWMEPSVMRVMLREHFLGSMRGRTMYVIPFAMGPVGSPLTRFGVEITDSPYVVASMYLMTRVTTKVLDEISRGSDWVPAVHSVGMPLVAQDGTKVKDVSWPCNPDNVYVVQYPETREIWSYGSGYGGNSLLGKKAMSLRIGSVLGRDEGWLAEHMLLVRLTAPTGKHYHVAAAFPSACGKTNLAMIQPTLQGWKAETLGDDIVWIKPDRNNGQLRAINPENGLFGVAPGTSLKTNSAAIQSMSKDTIFTNVAMTPEGDVWWEGLTENPPEGLIDWHGNLWSQDSGTPAAHPNARFCFPMANTVTLCEDWAEPDGVVLDAILFGGRRATNVPLVFESHSWQHGVFLGATISSEQTAAAEGPVGKLRRDPFAMLPFCGYNMADYFSHWLSMADHDFKLPRIFQVNWFRKDASGNFLWPGFGENIRALAWIVARLEGTAAGLASPIGTIPGPDELALDGLQITQANLEELFEIDSEAWLIEVQSTMEFFASFGEKLPAQLELELLQLEARLREYQSAPIRG